MFPIASVEPVPATAGGLSSSAVPNDSPSFFDVLTAAGLNPPPNSTERSTDTHSPFATGTSSEEQGLLPPATPPNAQISKDKNALDGDSLHPFLPGAMTAAAMLELNPAHSLSANFDTSRIESAILAEPVTAPNSGANPNAPSAALPSIHPAEPGVRSVTLRLDPPVAASPGNLRQSSLSNTVGSDLVPAISDCNGASTQPLLSASIPPDFDPPQEFAQPLPPASQELPATKPDPGSKPERIIAGSGVRSAGVESTGITTSTLPATIPPETKDESPYLRDLQISRAPATPSTENVSPPQEAAGVSISAAPSPTPQRPFTVPVAPEAFSAKAQLENSEENPPAIAPPTNALPPEPAARHFQKLQQVPSLHPRDLKLQAQPPIQTSPANIEQDPGNTSTAQHLPLPPTVSSPDSSVGASSETGEPSHQAGSSDHKTKAADALPFIAAPLAPPAAFTAVASTQPPTFTAPDPQAQSQTPTHIDTPLHPPSIPEAFQTPAPSPVHLAQIVSKAAQSEMRIGLKTSAFGCVELRTVVHANEVAVQIGSERGDLKTLLTTELPAITHTLQQHDLRLNQIRFEQQGFAFSSDTSQQRDAQPRSFSPKSISTSPFEYPPLESAPVPEFELRRSRGLSILA